MSETTLVGVRVHSWQWYKFRKWAEAHNLAPGDALTNAVQDFLTLQHISQDIIDSWLAEYHQEQKNEMD